MKNVDVVIIGAGAAGLFCASQLGQGGKSVVVLDNGKKLGRKILMSGGGNCNFTNMEISPHHYLCKNPHFVKSALARYTQWDFISMVASYGIAYHEKELGQLFCDEGAEQIVAMLKAECDKSGKVDIQLRQAVTLIEKFANFYHIHTASGTYQTENVVIATGGLSMPALGSTPFGYQIAEQFNIPVLPPRASLVPFTYKEKDKILVALSGIALPVTVTCGGQSFSNQMLFTHRGLSGPAMLQISNYWELGNSVEIDLLPTISILDILNELRQSSPKLQLKSVLCRHLPKKLVELWFEQKLLKEKIIADLSKVELTHLEQFIHHWQFVPNGTEGYRTAEVTKGGVDTDFISSKTMETKQTKGLYFIGEVLDVTGWLGGYNFQWAWSSAFVCATGILESD
ncbi:MULTISPECIES: NAD(P)/FAD-dependent oxidoreductase [Pasteurellaceae]|uniref:NAD(P)/FAD-dependent oxidoreductase n=1 Tax=Pasteurella atlantica TaxID=2827233 RepID=A0AAW8CF01_9PAST|nr:NAD(P)/FAD-dependent oxidoreductase [Pasteurella atlantica]MBR0572885.1 NAD(P)/FAD-dependent oxidoreductase [Pasteurella atlantica]MDP8038813.1 NAD(P)/FAD-dependent oxidoreductase [Pasteurella atlantica]MDP8040904.1 NAD(P)/FAD-dependent oxidoreductase [Pasteurella atlantica]MDP8042922.1 NAD(P)/FAD-dependent oxidoreductase [Pasteurella atlantica]MDP8045009.1 NAD(P)/FAD-dependent oxidoreductase [Pasteurella atlantica]